MPKKPPTSKTAPKKAADKTQAATSARKPALKQPGRIAKAAKATSRAELPMDTETMGRVLEILQGVYDVHPMGELTRKDPYKVLVACIMSLRTKDEMTIPLARKLFEVADTPQKMVRLSADELARLIYPVGFYKTKAVSILEFSQRLIDEYGGRVPDTVEELVKFKGVGRKTANLVVGLGHGLPAVCVDVHVHRICHRLGYLDTKDPDETEMALREKLPQRYWNVINTMLVLHGQQVCKPIGPCCDICPVAHLCAQVDVKPRKPAAVKS